MLCANISCKNANTEKEISSQLRKDNSTQFVLPQQTKIILSTQKIWLECVQVRGSHSTAMAASFGNPKIPKYQDEKARAGGNSGFYQATTSEATKFSRDAYPRGHHKSVLEETSCSFHYL